MNGNTQSTNEEQDEQTTEEYEVTAYVNDEIKVGEQVKLNPQSGIIYGEVTDQIEPGDVDVDVCGEIVSAYTVEERNRDDFTVAIEENYNEFRGETKTHVHVEMPDKVYYDDWEKLHIDVDVKRTAEVSVPTDCVDYDLDADVTDIDGIGKKTDQELYADTVGELIARLCVDSGGYATIGTELTRRVDDDIRFAGTRTDEYGVEIDYRVPDDVDLDEDEDDDEEQEVEQDGGVSPEVQTGERTVEGEQEEEEKEVEQAGGVDPEVQTGERTVEGDDENEQEEKRTIVVDEDTLVEALWENWHKYDNRDVKWMVSVEKGFEGEVEGWMGTLDTSLIAEDRRRLGPKRFFDGIGTRMVTYDETREWYEFADHNPDAIPDDKPADVAYHDRDEIDEWKEWREEAKQYVRDEWRAHLSDTVTIYKRGDYGQKVEEEVEVRYE